MKFSFSNYKLTDRASAILLTPDEKTIGMLSNLIDLSASIYYNETSSVSFEISDTVNNIKTPFYDDVVGMNIVDIRVGDERLGRFILTEPEETNNGIHRIKSCKAYSLEYEMTYKKVFFEEGTYNFWNPVTPDSSVIGIILSYLPAWSIGEIDESLIGKYRTFTVSGENIYNFIKNTLQKTYQCIFDFDTYTRKIYVRPADADVDSTPVYLSSNNLAKEIKLKENTEGILTVLDVNGADGVTIRSVNPLGTNKIYNLDHFMTEKYFSIDIIDKWTAWKTLFDASAEQYYQLTIQRVLKTSEILLLENQINKAKEVDLASLENERAVYIEYIASLSNTSGAEYQKYAQILDETNEEIERLQERIRALEERLTEENQEKDVITESLREINASVAFSAFFTDDEMCMLNRYFKEDSLADSNFVYSEVQSYDNKDICTSAELTEVIITTDNKTEYEVSETRHGYSVTGGSIQVIFDGLEYMLGSIVRADIAFMEDSRVLLTAFLGGGTVIGEEYPGGCMVLSGVCQSSDELTFTASDVSFYLTQNTTDYQKYSVEKELYEFGVNSLNQLAFPSYTFDITSANFFMMDTFLSFANAISLGSKIYLELSDSNVIEPIFIGYKISFDNPDDLDLIFSDTYTVSDKAFHLVDLLEQSISMGHSLDTNRFSYSAFIDSGASSSVRDFMNSAIDASKNAVIAGSNMAVSIDRSGLHARKYKTDGTGYEPEEIAIINNSIVFTDDNWKTAKMAIGQYDDPNLGRVWGIVAPNITGTLLAGQNLVIESVKKDGETAVFKVDGDGAVLHNAKFDIDNGVSHIVLDPVLGFGIGEYPVITDEDGTPAWDKTKAKFWVDTDGNVNIRGIVEAKDFLINGESVLTEEFKIISDYLDLGNIQLDGETGDITMTGNINLSDASSINWGKNKPTADVTYDSIKSALQAANGTTETFITADAAGAPNIFGANIYGAKIFAGTGSTDEYSVMDEDGFHIHTKYTGSFDLYAPFGSSDEYHFLSISYREDLSPYIMFQSPDGAYAEWTFGRTAFRNWVEFYGNVTFNGSVEGLTVVFG